MQADDDSTPAAGFAKASERHPYWRAFLLSTFYVLLSTFAVIHVVDTLQLGRPKIIAATALETAEGVVLFDTGAESTFDNVANALRVVGAEPRDVRRVFLSHIHFDHAGAAWRFAELGATVYVHLRGAPHLLDPTRLVESATRIFGEQMEKLWGRIAPVPAERLRVLNDGDVVRVAEFEIRAIATPGHATHHHVYHWDDIVFGGDVAGVRLGNGPPIPPFVPPELHVEAWRESLQKIRALNAAKMYLPHFGLAGGAVGDHLDVLDNRVVRWAQWFRDRIRSADDEAELIRNFAELEATELQASGADAALVLDYETADPSHMAVPAALRYWRKYHPEEVGAES
ncbi:MAG: MBL fold metallo-hydrolase [Chthoniobacterales bacterium]